MYFLSLSHCDMATIAESGQCFRLVSVAPGAWRLVALGRALSIRQVDGGFLLDCDEVEFDQLWRGYFDADTDYERCVCAIPPEDAFLCAAAKYGGGIRILRQDPWEALVTFIISQRKNIPAIRGAVESLSARFGAPILDAPGAFAFPSPDALARETEASLRSCALGYRAPYVLEAARRAAEGTLDLAAMETLSNESLMERLIELPGVGVKVASCAMLFGFHRLDAFPRDVWINRVIEREYAGNFPLERYAGFAGVIQQYMFYYGRSAAYAALQNAE